MHVFLRSVATLRWAAAIQWLAAGAGGNLVLLKPIDIVDIVHATFVL